MLMNHLLWILPGLIFLILALLIWFVQLWLDPPKLIVNKYDKFPRMLGLLFIDYDHTFQIKIGVFCWDILIWWYKKGFKNDNTTKTH